MYSSMDYATSELTMENHVRVNLEPLFVKYGVDVAFWGHMHCYERTCPVINGLCQGTLDKPGNYHKHMRGLTCPRSPNTFRDWNGR
jgi:hypothetical protein